MPLYLLSALIYALLQLLYGWVARKKHQAKVFIYLGIGLSAAIFFGTLLFMSMNFDKKAALDVYNFFGWHIVGGCAVIALLLTGILWLVKKKIWPNAVFFFLNVGFLIIWALTRFWFSHKG